MWVLRNNFTIHNIRCKKQANQKRVHITLRRSVILNARLCTTSQTDYIGGVDWLQHRLDLVPQISFWRFEDKKKEERGRGKEETENASLFFPFFLYSNRQNEIPRGPHSQILLTRGGEGGGSDRGSYFIPIKITTTEFVGSVSSPRSGMSPRTRAHPRAAAGYRAYRICLPPKNHYFVLAYAKKSLSPFFANPKNPSVFFRDPIKNPASFIDPKKSLLAKISDPKISLAPPPVIKKCEWVPWDEIWSAWGRD